MRVDLSPLPKSSPRLPLPLRWFVIALTSVLVLASCQSTATVELTNPPNAAAPTANANTDPVFEDITPDTTPPEPADATDPNTDPTTDDSSTGGDDAATFDLRGELPLSTADVDGLISYIEEQTGRSFLRPPVIVAQSSQDFFAGLEDDMETFQSDSAVTVRTLQALGLTTSGVAEITQAFQDLLLSPEGILGYYDPATDELYVPVDTEGDDAFRSLLVHELTHALDGQHSDLTRLDTLIEDGDKTGNYEPFAALQAILEGRASAVQNGWMADKDVVVEIPEDLGAFEKVPAALVLSLSIPYVFGEQFIALNGGPAGSWDVLEAPPESSESFLVPGGIPAGEAITSVQTPAAEGPIIDEAVYGAIDILVWLLGESLEPDPALILPTFTAIDGWAGGRSVLWGDDSESCIRIAIAADTDTDLAEFEAAITPWASSGPNRSVEIERDLVIVTGCAPFVP